MDRDEFQRLASWFQRAIESDDRSAVIDACRAQDAGLVVRLEAMLAADDSRARDGDRLRASVVDEVATNLDSPLPERIGPFEVIRRLGTGGMGVVYLCRRAGPDFEQLVAVKRLPLAGDSDFARERLKMERRLLAGLRHPHIAQLVDGGEEDDGTPWVAMEYVDGQPIDQWAKERALDRRQRVRRFLALCDAVQFAHRNLVVHRDIKASNVLIDAHGQLKLLDFGIAKLVGGAERDDPGLTLAATMTPHYASPEQVRGESVTQASDVYSLGVLLYELLAGKRPYAFSTRRPSEIERVVCETEPPPLAGGSATDLDCVIARAMHKDPTRRYASAAELADDLRRWLNHRPVEARPDSSWYRMHTFARRNPLGVSAGLLAAFVLAGFSGAMAWQAHRLAEERDRASHEAQVANESADFLVQLFLDSDPLVQNPDDLRAIDLLNTAAQRLPESLPNDPLVRARLMGHVGVAFVNLGEFEQGLAILRDALVTSLRQAGEDSEETARARHRLGNALRQHGRLDEAEDLLGKALDWFHRTGFDEIELGQVYNDLGVVQRNLGRLEDAERSLRRAMQIYLEAAGESAPGLGATYHNLARTLIGMGELERARQFAVQSLENQRFNGSPPARIGLTLSHLAGIERQLGMFEEAELNARQSLALYRQVYGNDNHLVTRRMDDLAKVLYQLGEIEQVRDLFEEALTIHRNTDTLDQMPGARTRMSYGRFLLLIGEWQQARPLIEQAHRTALEFHQPDSVAMRAFNNGLKQLEQAMQADPDS